MTESLIGSFSIWQILLIVLFVIIVAVAVAGVVYYYRSTRSGKYISKPYRPSEYEHSALTVNCPGCNWANDGESVYCMRCGRVLVAQDNVIRTALRRCNECGCVLRRDDSSCPECGSPVHP